MKTPAIAKLLTLSQEEYEDKIFKLWMRYCESRAIDSRNDLQQLLANSALNAWWLNELSILEEEWYDEIKEYLTVIDPTTAMNHYNETIANIFRYRCPTLTKAARKLNIQTNQPLSN